MRPPLRPLLTAALSTLCLAGTAAHATTVIDFEGAALAGVYLPGDNQTAGNYRLTTLIDFGIVDTAAALGVVAPVGNASQFYFNSNDAALRITATNSVPFNLNGFDVAFVPLDPPSLQTTVIVARGLTAGGSVVQAHWAFAAPSASGQPFPFSSINVGALLAGNLTQLDFFACSLVGSAVCSQPTLNNGQFAIDNIRISPVPEPAAAWLLLGGLAALALRRHATLAPQA